MRSQSSIRHGLRTNAYWPLSQEEPGPALRYRKPSAPDHAFGKLITAYPRCKINRHNGGD
jgi:hypothetical protein